MAVRFAGDGVTSLQFADVFEIELPLYLSVVLSGFCRMNGFSVVHLCLHLERRMGKELYINSGSWRII